MPGKINAEWHRVHRMPSNPSLAQRIEWHLAHAKACGCRPIPAPVKAAISHASHVRTLRAGT